MQVGWKTHAVVLGCRWLSADNRAAWPTSASYSFSHCKLPSQSFQVPTGPGHLLLPLPLQLPPLATPATHLALSPSI